MNRRQFTKTSLAAAGAFALPRFSIGQSGTSANSRLNIAYIGAGNIAGMAYNETRGENWVALCDVDETFIAQAKAEYPEAKNARAFTDFREMFDKMGNEIDAVCVSTPDHTHFVATMWAMENGKHVCTQKPLTRTIWESRVLRKVAKEKGLITNMANQGHTYKGIRSAREWLEVGLIGDVHTVHSWEGGPQWTSKWFSKPDSFPPPAEPVPESLNWDLWLGPRPEDDYSPYYHPLKWRSFWQYGTGMLGDWFCHTCDGPVWTLDLYEPEYVERVAIGGDNGEHIIPDRSIVKWRFPARNGKPPCDLYWYDGGLKPSAPDNWSYGDMPYRGSFFRGKDNTLFLDERSNNPRLANREDMVDFLKGGLPPEKYPRVQYSGPFAEFVGAVKGEGPLPGASFDYASKLTEVALLGVMAQRFGGRIEWDAKSGRVTNRLELNAYVREEPRTGWAIGEQYTRSIA